MPDRIRPTRVLTWWLAVVLVVLVLAAGAAYVYLVGFFFGPNNPYSRVVSDALGPALLIVGVFGALVALLIAARAQGLRERIQRHRELAEPEKREHEERVRAHEERVHSVEQRQQEQMARATETDAAERRSSDVSMRAIEQLGSERAAVRIGALAMLERLAQQSPEHRQMVVDVICGYLRLPAAPDADLGQERGVRQTAQRLLLRHLSPADRRTQWRGVRLDFSDSTLVDFDASGCVLSDTDFTGALFLGTTSFADCVFDGSARFAETRFGGPAVSFHRARFASDMGFVRATFGCPADFGLVHFTQPTVFDQVRFDSDASFYGARFGESVVLSDVDFGGASAFRAAAFEGDITLVRTLFRGPATFAESTLSGHSWFEEVRGSTAAVHVFPPGYREVQIDDSWVILEHEMPVASPDGVRDAAPEDAVER